MFPIPDAAKSKLSPEAFANLERWQRDEAFADSLEGLEDALATSDWTDTEDAFYDRLSVGTGGIRGRMGAGPNRMNKRTIREAAQALSEFIRGVGGEELVKRGVVIGHEVRLQGREFAELSAEVFAGNGIPVFLFPSVRATPQISFAVRHLKTAAGVMITASHNPRTDNGFKFYWSDGGQVVPPLDTKFMDLVRDVKEIKQLPLADARTQGLVKGTPAEVDDAYFSSVLGLSLSPSRSATIAFSPMHGAGSVNVQPVLEQAGFSVTIVTEQQEPDGHFPTASTDLINPEYPQVTAMAEALATKVGADLSLTSDPDADRIAVACRMEKKKNGVARLSGNEVGALLTHFILSQRQAAGTLPSDGVIATTYVTTSLMGEIGRAFNVNVTDDLLVGFKYIAEVIEKLPDPKKFLFAAEESLGYLAGDFIRDKDAAIAALLVAELVSTLKDQGKTVFEYLDDIYRQFGYFKNTLAVIERPGRAGKIATRATMTGLRERPPTELASHPVTSIVDRLPETKRSGDAYRTGMTGDQITFILDDDDKNRVTVRPSGTEPIVKCYTQRRADVATDADLIAIKRETDANALKIEKAIVELCKEYGNG